MYIILGEAGVFPLIGDWKTLTLLVGTGFDQNSVTPPPPPGQPEIAFVYQGWLLR